MNRITGRSAFLALLKDEGVTHLFGNPGTTELPIMHALKEHPDLTYVMAMQESLGPPRRLQCPRSAWAGECHGRAVQCQFYRYSHDPDRRSAGAGARPYGADALWAACQDCRAAGEVGR